MKKQIKLRFALIHQLHSIALGVMFLLLVIIVGLMGYGLYQFMRPTISYDEYMNQKFIIKYPEGWEVQKEEGVVTFVDTQTDETVQITTNLSIATYDRSADPITKDECDLFAEAAQLQYSDSIENPSLQGIEIFDTKYLKNLCRITVKGNMNSIGITFSQVAISSKNMVFIISYGGQTNDGQSLNTLEKMLDTFQVL